jgi:hypothetical protein
MNGFQKNKKDENSKEMNDKLIHKKYEKILQLFDRFFIHFGEALFPFRRFSFFELDDEIDYSLHYQSIINEKQKSKDS